MLCLLRYISVFSFCMVFSAAAADVGSVFTDHFALHSAWQPVWRTTSTIACICIYLPPADVAQMDRILVFQANLHEIFQHEKNMVSKIQRGSVGGALLETLINLKVMKVRLSHPSTWIYSVFVFLEQNSLIRMLVAFSRHCCRCLHAFLSKPYIIHKALASPFPAYFCSKCRNSDSL